MPRRQPPIHRTATGLAEHEGQPLHLHVPAYTLAELRRAYPSGQVHCGSCGELLDFQLSFEKTEERWGPETVMTFALSHEYFPADFLRQDTPPDGEGQSTGQCPVLYSDGVRDEYVLRDDGRYERLYGIVYRDARSPERVYREVWYPTGVFRAAAEVADAAT